MPVGPGKYDDLCTNVLKETKAGGVLLVVLDGTRGTGFSMTATADIVAFLPGILRQVANDIENSGGHG